MKMHIFKTSDEVITHLAAFFIEAARLSIVNHGRFSIALSGGVSPQKLYELLASATFRDKVEWDKVYFFFGDERYVPKTDPASNYLMVKKALFKPLNIHPSHVFSVDTKLDPREAAEQYTKVISDYFGDDEWRFDIVLLGLGDNCHTASLFPYTPVLRDTMPSVAAVYLEDQGVYRITMNAPLINQAHQVAFLVYGESKAAAVHHVIEDERNTDHFPAQLIAPQYEALQWFLDAAAASKLKK